MSQERLRFDDGEAYKRGMEPWSKLVGHVFLDWLSPESGLCWVDIGCGNGAFTEVLVQRCAPTEMQGIDPSEVQIDFARTREGAHGATFRQGDAMALPFDDNRFDAAVMALVLFFVPDPAKGVAEMVRVVKPDGTVSAYLWDIFSDEHPTSPMQAELLAFGVPLWRPPSAEASRMTVLRDLWTHAGLDAVETHEITVRRIFADFEDFWSSITAMQTIGGPIAGMVPGDVYQLRERLQVRLPADAQGRISYDARANAIKGRVRK